MQDNLVALVTGANQGIGLQVVKGLAAKDFKALVGSRNLGRGEQAAKTIAGDVRAIHLDVTNKRSIDLNDYAGVESVEEGAREVMRLALIDPDEPTGAFSQADGPLPR